MHKAFLTKIFNFLMPSYVALKFVYIFSHWLYLDYVLCLQVTHCKLLVLDFEQCMLMTS